MEAISGYIDFKEASLKKKFILLKNSNDEIFIVNIKEIRTIFQKDTFVELHLKNRTQLNSLGYTIIRINNTFEEVVSLLQNAGQL